MSTEQKKEYWKSRSLRLKEERLARKPPEPIDLLTDTDLAYIAGLIDGEGSISIGKNANGMHVPTIDVVMCHEGVINWLAGVLRVTVMQRPPRKPNHNIQYHARIAGGRATHLCQRILPYMRVKHQQAALVCEFRKTYRGGYDFPGLPEETKSLRDSMKMEMHRLNNHHNSPLN